jgi:hypothetical protein
VYLKEERLMMSMQEINKQLKEDARKTPKIKLDIPESFIKPYTGPSTRQHMLSLEEEVRDMIVASRSGQILKLEPEEVDRDEVMQMEEEEDE